ncbi:hypothetical protein BDV23DRAFT_186093 [Aspergillus alliaceus]|uniref:Uncharacterized protein n=1 Tax=Petromyces alliaceus TaxID=209559 RepID=A0A5N7C0S7_PETAA|nr:hypothetical protein BDV23DRAFT_186093 [Aspergillus alliaceus]
MDDKTISDYESLPSSKEAFASFNPHGTADWFQSKESTSRKATKLLELFETNYYDESDTDGDGSPTLTHLPRKEKPKGEFDSPVSFLREPSTDLELHPSPIIGSLPSVEGSLDGMEDESWSERNLDSLPPLPLSCPHTSEGRVLHPPYTKAASSSYQEQTNPDTEASIDDGLSGVVDRPLVAEITNDKSILSAEENFHRRVERSRFELKNDDSLSGKKKKNCESSNPSKPSLEPVPIPSVPSSPISCVSNEYSILEEVNEEVMAVAHTVRKDVRVGLSDTSLKTAPLMARNFKVPVKRRNRASRVTEVVQLGNVPPTKPKAKATRWISAAFQRLRRLFVPHDRPKLSHPNFAKETDRSLNNLTRPPHIQLEEANNASIMNLALVPTVPDSIPPSSVGPTRRTLLERELLSKIFEGQLTLLTSSSEPSWVSSAPSSQSLFPGWKKLRVYPLTPQGKFVAETKKHLDIVFENVEFGANAQVLGSGGGLTTKGVPALLKSFTDYEWMSMWRSSEDRSIHISESLLKPDPNSPSSSDTDLVQMYESELLSLDKYKGGHSEYLTVVTHSEEFTGTVALFRASFEDSSLITGLELVAYIKEIPRQICRVLRQGIKMNRYEIHRKGLSLKCTVRGELPRPRLASVSSKEPWTSIGGGWRYALNVTSASDSYFKEGLIASIPQIIACLHLRHGLISDILSSPVLKFEAPLASSGELPIRRGVRLLGPPKGYPHVGDNIRIAVLFPGDSEWATEQFLWA